MSPLQLDPSLKLTHCPACDYSLQGLPETGICPECGRGYENGDFILLRGSTIGYGRLLIESVWSVFLVFLLCLRWPVLFSFVLGLCAAITAIRLGMPLLGLVQSRRQRVWLCAAGIGRQAIAVVGSSTDRVYLLAGILEIASLPLVAITIDLALIARLIQQTTVYLACLETAMVVLSLIVGPIVHVARRSPVATRADGVRPALVPWRFFGSVELEELGNGRHQLWARISPHIRPKDVVLISFHASPEGIRQLHELLVQWAEPEIAVKLKPFRGSRKLKRFV